MASITNANNRERMEGMLRIVLPLAGSSLGLPDGALLLRVAWMKGAIPYEVQWRVGLACKEFRNALSHVVILKSDQKRSQPIPRTASRAAQQCRGFE